MIETDRIVLRPWSDSDAEVLYKWASDPDVGPRDVWALLFPSHHSKQGNGIPALHCSPNDVIVYHPHHHCGRYRHICSGRRGTFYTNKKMITTKYKKYNMAITSERLRQTFSEGGAQENSQRQVSIIMPIRHKSMQNIPDIWLYSQICILLQHRNV